MISNRENGVVYLVVSQAIVAFQGVYYRYLLQKGFPMIQVFFSLSLTCALVAITLALTFSRKNLLLSRGMLALSCMGGLCGNLLGVSLYSAIQLIPLGNAMALGRLAPVMAALLGYLFGWEALNLQILAGVALCSGAAIFIEQPPFLFGGQSSWTKSDTVGCAFALCSALFLTSLAMITAKIGSKVHTLVYLVWFNLAGISMHSILLAAKFPSPPVFSMPWDSWLLLLGFCVLSVIKNFATVRGFQLCNATLSSSLTTLSVIFSFALGYFISNEDISIFAVAGIIALILGIIAVSTGKRKLHK